jgi:hypothetical protein
MKVGPLGVYEVMPSTCMCLAISYTPLTLIL